MEGAAPVKFTLEFFSPIRPLANARGSALALARERRVVRDLVLSKWPPSFLGCLAGINLEPGRGGACPVVVDFVRYSRRTLDDDNLINAFKPARDEVARCLGLKNDANPAVLWTCQQQPLNWNREAWRLEVSGAWSVSVSIDLYRALTPNPIQPRHGARKKAHALAARAKPNTHPPRPKAKP